MKFAIAGAIVSGGMAAATGGNIWKAAAAGFIAGGLGGLPSGYGHAGAIAGGAIGALIQGGDPAMGALMAGISAGVAGCCKVGPIPSLCQRLFDDLYLYELALSAISGAIAGGVTSEMLGGSFAQQPA